MNYQLPPFQPQSSPPFESASCPNEVFINCVEMVQGVFQQWSVTASAVLSHTVPGVGNDIVDVIASANKTGLISYSSRPLPPVFNQSVYYAPLTAEQLATANKSWQFSLVAPDLNVSPIILRLNEGGGIFHFVLTRDMKNEIDSYAPQVKPIIWSQVVAQYSLLIKPNFTTPGFKVANSDTVYVQVMNKFIPVADWNAFVNLGGSEKSIVTVTQDLLNNFDIISSDNFSSQK